MPETQRTPHATAARRSPGERRLAVVEVTAASAATVFSLVSDADRWHDWAGPAVARSYWQSGGTGRLGSVRRLGRFPVMAREQVVVHDPPHRHGYIALSGLPMDDYRADVVLQPDPGGGTRIEWSASFRARIPGTGAALQALLTRTVSGFARRLGAAAAAEDALLAP